MKTTSPWWSPSTLRTARARASRDGHPAILPDEKTKVLQGWNEGGRTCSAAELPRKTTTPLAVGRRAFAIPAVLLHLRAGPLNVRTRMPTLSFLLLLMTPVRWMWAVSGSGLPGIDGRYASVAQQQRPYFSAAVFLLVLPALVRS